MNWIMLVVAGFFEVGRAVGLKYTEGFTRTWPSIWTMAAMAVSLGLLGIALKSLPVGTAYAVWVGVGVAGTAIAGMILFGEAMSIARAASLLLVVIGIFGLKMTSGA